jgi:hypothetical protein
MRQEKPMDRHIQLAAILNIVYRSLSLIGGIVLIVISGFVSHIFEWLLRSGNLRVEEFPVEIIEIITPILAAIGFAILLFSILGIVAALGVMKRKEWGRMLLLIVSFFTLLRFPLGTLLAAYTIWVLLNNDSIKAFNPQATVPTAPVA